MQGISTNQINLGTGILTATGNSLYINGVSPPFTKSITVETPAAADNLTLFYTAQNISVSSLDSIVSGANTSVSYTVRSGPQRTGNGYELVVGGTTVTDTSSGSHVTSLTNPVITGGNWTWLSVTGITGSRRYNSI
jgi:hypothetical protein